MSLQTTKNKKGSSNEPPFFLFPLHAIWQKTKKSIYKDDHGELAFETVGKSRVVAGDPKAIDLSEQVRCFQNFVECAHKNNYSVCGYYFSEEFAYASEFNVHQAGVSIFHSLEDWDLKGGNSEEYRRVLRKGLSGSLETLEITSQNIFLWKNKILAFSKEWIRYKGPIQIKFILSPLENLEEHLNSGERFFICEKEGEVQGLISLRQFSKSQWYLDHLMQGPLGHRFALDYLCAKVFWKLKEEGAGLICLGFCPGIIKKPTTWIERVLRLWTSWAIVYSPQGLYRFKKKYGGIEKPRYLLLDPSASQLRQIVNMERATLFWSRHRKIDRTSGHEAW